MTMPSGSSTKRQKQPFCRRRDSLAARLTHAVDVLVEVLDNQENPSTVRVSAADSILRHGLRYIEAGNILVRLDALEQRTNSEG